MEIKVEHIFDLDKNTWKDLNKDFQKVSMKLNSFKYNKVKRIQCKCCGAYKIVNTACEYCGI